MKNVFKTLNGAAQYIKDIQDIGAVDITLKVSGNDYIVNFSMPRTTVVKLFGNNNHLAGFTR